MIDLGWTDEQMAIREAIERKCQKYSANYWLERDTDGRFPEEFVQDIAADGWLGIAMPEQYGGAGLGVTEACIMMQAITESGAGYTGGGGVHINVFGPSPIVAYGTEEQKHRTPPPLMRDDDRGSFGVTEPNAGLYTTPIETKAERAGSTYILNDRKMWTTTAQRANKRLLLVRTTPRDQSSAPTGGMSLFST